MVDVFKFADLCLKSLETLGEHSQKRDGFIRYLLGVSTILIVIIPDAVYGVGGGGGRRGCSSGRGGWPFAVRLSMRHGVSAELNVSPGWS